MKYWWLKKYKGLKIRLIPDLIRDVNTYFILPKNYKERYSMIKTSDISTLEEEDLKIMLFSILNHERIKNNRVILIIDALLKIPDNFLPEVSYTVSEMLEEIKHLREYNEEDKLLSNNVSACFHCLEVFYVDKIKYRNKKGQCLCPYCKHSTLYFDNDFLPMDYNFLRLAKLYFENTALGCSYQNIQRLLKKCVCLKKQIDFSTLHDYAYILKGKKQDTILDSDHIRFFLPETLLKKQITSREEFEVEYQLNECFFLIEKNLISTVVLDTSLFTNSKSSSLNLSCLLTVLENLGRNPYLKRVFLVAENSLQFSLFSKMIADLEKKSPLLNNFSL